MTWPETAYNPSPLPGDLSLPMPCGGAMVFRAVPAGSSGPLDDLTVELGSDDPEQGYAELRRRTSVAGPFEDEAGRYLLMGKYEVNNLQFQAVTGDHLDKACPRAAETPTPARTDLGWHEAALFAHRYSLWLAANAEQIPSCDPGMGPTVSPSEKGAPPPCLPRRDGVPAFVRLPTEVEWELAARGGTAVSPSELRAPTYPMPEGMERHVWFNANADGEIKPIGLRRPNPLGLFDMLGNAEEMVLEPFRLRLPGRVHGQVGGFVVRGGSIRSDEQEIRASLRREVPYYNVDGPVRTPDTGFRLLASLPVFTSTERLNQIRAAWGRLGREKTADSPPAAPVPEVEADAGSGVEEPPNPPADVIDQIAEMTRTAPDSRMKQRLERLQSQLAEERARFHEQRLSATREGLRFGGLTCSKLHDEGHNLELLRAALEICVKGRGRDSPRCVQRAKRLERDEGVMRENVRYHADTVVRTAQTYADAPEVLDRAFDDLAAGLAQRGYPNLKVYPQTFLAQVRDYAAGNRSRPDAWYRQCRGLP